MKNTNKNYGLLYIEGLRGSKLIIYQRFFKHIYHNLKYINDFFEISAIRERISIYRQIVT
ncbi:hypothetical protein CN271_14005 [Bacillus cereus]|nr:hypothetical protein CON59_20260 [Bacillus cereus]PET48613.1 hypothetical protein CN523_09765 [Bacillus cereus]PEV78038.1 hypothetical protein CN429_19245 [Bacillus cereus]PFA61123.1 hypothetical protein CN389_00285 [Bacillus cereus]PFD72281.1 hypothetical protein CN271_14005 [Bacillus cereus]